MNIFYLIGETLAYILTGLAVFAIGMIGFLAIVAALAWGYELLVEHPLRWIRDDWRKGIGKVLKFVFSAIVWGFGILMVLVGLYQGGKDIWT